MGTVKITEWYEEGKEAFGHVEPEVLHAQEYIAGTALVCTSAELA
jgi:hypothetical protein